MLSAMLPANEQARLETLYSLNILDTPPEERFDRITRTAARYFQAPISTVTLVDQNRQWFKSCIGVDDTENPRTVSFCAHAILSNDILVIPDALIDPRFSDNPLVTDKPYIRFYAGCPLVAPDGSVLGTLCIIDRKPRHMSKDDLDALRDLGFWAQTELNLVQSLKKTQEQKIQLEEAEQIAHIGSWELDLATGEVQWSDELFRIFGYEPGEIEPSMESAFSFIHPADKERLEQLYTQVLSQSAPGEEYDVDATTEFRIICKDSSVRVVHAQGRVFHRDGDAEVEAEMVGPAEIGAGRPAFTYTKVSKLVATIHDITARKEAEDALKESEDRYRRLTEISPNSIVLIEPGGTILLANMRAAELVGVENREQLVGSNVFDSIVPERQAQARQGILRAMQNGSTEDSEYLLLHKSGTKLPVEVSSSVTKYVNGVPSELLLVARDISQRKAAEAQIRKQLDRLSSLHKIDMAIAASLDLNLTLDVILDQVSSHLGVDAADVLLLNKSTQMLTFARGRGLLTGELAQSALRLGQGHAGRAALEQQLIHIPDLREEPDFLRAHLIANESFVSYYGVPLVAKGDVQGVLEIFHRSRLEPDDEWLDFLAILAGQIAIAIDNSSLFAGLQRSNTELSLAYDTTLEGWSRALDLRDEETEGHTRRVTDITLRLAQAMGLENSELVHVRRGALLHDIGKMGIPDAILLKPGPLTDEEWVIMRKHPVYAYELLSPISFLKSSLDIPYCHHEKWDGTGYPRGLKGEQIPMAARIFAVVDVYDALTSNRPYRAAWSRERTLEHIGSLSGTHFDPEVVEAFLRLNA